MGGCVLLVGKRAADQGIAELVVLSRVLERVIVALQPDLLVPDIIPPDVVHQVDPVLGAADLQDLAREAAALLFDEQDVADGMGGAA